VEPGLQKLLCILSQKIASGCNNLPNPVQYNIFEVPVVVCRLSKQDCNQTNYKMLNADWSIRVGVFVLITTPSVKKQDTKLLPISSPNIDRFSNFFHC